jgi:agmatinase
MIDSIISAKKIEEAEVVILQAPYEHTTSSRKGTSSGPESVLKMLEGKLELFDREYKKNVCEYVKIGQKEIKNINKLNPEQALEKITQESKELLDQNKFVFLVGGEHSVSLGLLTALSEKVKPKDVTILQIDAHCDLRNDDSDYSDDPTDLAHSCVLRRAHELGYNLVQVGIRTYFKGEYDYFTKNKKTITVFEWANGKKNPTVDQVLKSIKTKYVYITIDVDGFDPSVMPGTGTAVQGGLTWEYGSALLDKVVKSKEIIGADLVEVAPMQDTILTEYGSAQLIYKIIANKFKKKLK